VTIIGAGPAGLLTGVYGGMREAKVKIIESLPHVGGHLTALYTEKHLCDVAGFPGIKAQDLVDNLNEQIKIFEYTSVLNLSIEKVKKDSDNLFELTSHTGEVHYSRTIIITAGNGAFEPRRLNINTSEDFENVNLHYYVDDMNRYADEHV